MAGIRTTATFSGDSNRGVQLASNSGHVQVNYHGRPDIIQQDRWLDKLPNATQAAFNPSERQHDPMCLHNTRVSLLNEIRAWADGQDERSIYWLNGLAGTGKSTIARTIAREYFDHRRLGASFFFSKGGGDVSHAGKFFTTIAFQLAEKSPSLRSYISGAVSENTSIMSQSLRDQWRQLIFQPFSKLDGKSSRSSYILVVDALDECGSENDIRAILQLLAEVHSLKTVQLRVFLTSRPEIAIRHGFYQISDTKHLDFVLHNISPSTIDHDIRIFLEFNFKLIGQERSLDTGWPGEHIINSLIQNASGLFIWAATVCRFVGDGKRFAVKRLAMILEGSMDSTTAPEKHLNEIYVTVLKQSIKSNFTDEEREDLYWMLRQILGSIVILFSPLSIDSLCKLLHVTKQDVHQTLEDLHAILDIPMDPTQPLRLHHPSFRDFLTNKNRCGDLNFWIDESQAHQILADKSIRLMANSLKQDICSLDAYGASATDIDSSRLQQCLSQEVQYACLYWIQHLQRSGGRLYDDDQVHQFLQAHVLHWLEALSWMRKVSEGIHAIVSLESIVLSSGCPGLYAFIHDIKRFALYGRPAIEQAPLQVYCSALMFAPMMSIVRTMFENQIPHWIKRSPEVKQNWNATLQTLEGHSLWINAIAFSPDGKVLASASNDQTVKLWDAGTGAALQTLEGHSDSVNTVAFSPDGKVLASASNDRTVKLWDAGTGAALQTLEGHSDLVNTVAFSPDGKVLASASNDWTIKLWDAGTGAALQTLEGHLIWLKAKAFSPDGKVLASASDDWTVKLWDAGTGAALQTLEGHSDSVNTVAFLPDGKVLASASDDWTVKLWDAGTGAALQTLEDHSDWVNTVAFSPDGKVLVSASDDCDIKFWDAGTGAALQTLQGHLDSVKAVAFSPDGMVLASASNDETVKLWDTCMGAATQTLEGRSDWINAVAFSSDGRVLVLASDDRTVKLWDAGTGAALQTLEGHDWTIKLWDAGTGAALQTLEAHSNWINAVAFSPDGKVLASASNDRTIKLWDAGTGAALQTLEGHSTWINAVAFSLDGKVLASASNDGTIKLWDAGMGVALQTLKGHLDSVNAIAYSPDGKLLASASDDQTVKLWDADTGAVLQTFESDGVIRTISFTDDWTFVDTDKGILRVKKFSPSEVPQRNISDKISVKEEWITLGNENVIWLPSEYRPRCIAVHKSVIALGHTYSRPFFLEIEL